MGASSAPVVWDGFYFESLQNGSTVSMGRHGSGTAEEKAMLSPFSLVYSVDGGNTFSAFDCDSDGTVVTLGAGERAYFKSGPGGNSSICGANVKLSKAYRSFSGTGRLSCGGNVMSLLTQKQRVPTEFGTVFPSPPHRTEFNVGVFSALFSHLTALETAADLVLPSDVNHSCYYAMFDHCTSLTGAPRLPATSLAEYCYSYMFLHCDSLVSAPVLPAFDLGADDALTYMFQFCLSLSEIEVRFPSFSFPGVSGMFHRWVSNVKNDGTCVFRCPAALGTGATISRAIMRARPTGPW